MVNAQRVHARRRPLVGIATLVGFGLLAGCAQLAALESFPDRAPAASPARDNLALRTAPDVPTYTVSPGDTLHGIAEAHDVTLERLVTLNGIEDPARIEAGAVLRLDEQPTYPVVQLPRSKEIESSPPLELPFGITWQAAQLGAAVAAVPLALGATYIVLSLVVDAMFAAARGLRQFGLSARRRLGRRAAEAPEIPAPAPRPVLVFALDRATSAAEPARTHPAVATPEEARRLARALLPRPIEWSRWRLVASKLGASVRRGAARLAASGVTGLWGLAGRLRGAVASDSALGQGVRRGRASLEHSLQDARLRRQGFAADGAFWIRGGALLRLGSVDAAEEHYRSGIEMCAQQGWSLEGARCLERLAHLASLRGDAEAARASLAEGLALALAHPDGAELAHELASRIAATADRSPDRDSAATSS